jgi:hypothetical protein
MLVFGVVMAGLLLLAVLVLAVPLDFSFRLEGVDAAAVNPVSGDVAVAWLFGFLRLSFPVPANRSRATPRVAGKADASRSKAKTAKGRKRPDFSAMIGQARFRRRLYRFVKDLIRAAHLQQLRLRMRLGLGDPADTGRLWALMGPLHAAVQNLRCADVQIEAEFVDPVFEFQASGQLRLVPLHFLLLAVAFALSPSSIRAWYTLASSRA